jgi:lipopolysaccharide transport system ATP-binding protein
MEEVSNSGRTILFVSHNMEAVAALTTRCGLLENGRLVQFGETNHTIARYLEGKNTERVFVANTTVTEPTISRVELRTSLPDNYQLQGDQLEVHIDVTTPEPITGCRIAVRCCDELLRKTLYTWIYDADQPICRTSGTHHLVCRIPKLRLYKGRYTFQIHLSEHFGGRHFQVLEGVCPFEVVMYGRSRDGGFGPDEGVYIEDCHWTVEAKDNSESTLASSTSI